MAIALGTILGGLDVIKKVNNLFKRKHGHKSKTKIDEALETVESFVRADVDTDSELRELLIKKEIELEKTYTERAKAALEVIKAESSSDDPYVRRARPTWLYMGVVVMLAQMVVMPFYGIKLSDYIDSQSLNWFYTVVGSGYLGYGILRTIDKNKK